MKAVGIIVEYNPFHNGHFYHVEEARKKANADVVIAVMSASFLQRGEPAIVSKWQRAKMALAGGVDLVIELPYIHSVQKAELFAKGAVTILAEMGAESINFGSESGDINAFYELVHVMEQNRTEFNRLVKEQMNSGVSYPRALAEAFGRLNLPTALSLDQPNNILGYHYVKAIYEGDYEMRATTTLRRQAQFHDKSVPSSSIASATSIRKALNEIEQLSEIKHVMPESTLRLLKDYTDSLSMLHTWEHYFPLLHFKVMSTSETELRNIYECEEGLEYRVKEMMKTATSFHDWMSKLKTKRYTWTRLQRLATHMLTNTKKIEIEEALSEEMPYIRLLGMNERGQTFLNLTRKKRQIPLITRAAKADGIMAAIEGRATNIYYAPLPAHIRVRQLKNEFQRTPIRF